ncbi:asparagine synthase-related protein [Streptantibioticus rubrisoli]|uniref:Asparagine synthase-related protein n=1 Tax=Streptantibioticus rubrisoli TaxID=1387313 RepID=A0ABT1P806_9ACTN|nr:asparagine synthase-related protein [Streptantibioticus rubrisoli]MCQ4040470.1 asparagine synthase-related protein [Streptantibioticus rubrisoli]
MRSALPGGYHMDSFTWGRGVTKMAENEVVEYEAPEMLDGAFLGQPFLASGTAVLKQASGGTWVVADDSHSRLVSAEASARRLALFGETDIEVGRLARLLERHGSARDVMAAAHEIPGSFHILYTDGRTMVVQGSASGLRQVFYARLADHAHVASDSVELLARLCGGGPRIEMVAWGMVHPGFDYGLTEGTYWKGVRRLPADQRLHLTGDRVERSTWWSPPVPALSIAEGAPGLRSALDEAVAVRVGTARGLSADLSGGMDSTSLCFLLAEQGARFQAFVEQTIDPNHDDARWAAIAAREMDRELTVLQPDDIPGPYDGIWERDEGLVQTVPYGLGEPYTLIRNRARKAAMSKLFAATGATVHIGGFGGDELFTVPPSYFSDLYASSPLKAIRGIRDLARLRRWSLKSVLRSLARQQSYRGWFEEQLRDLRLPRPDTLGPTVNWGPPLRVTPWSTPVNVEAIRSLARAEDAACRPQAPSRAAHTCIAGQRIGGQRLGPLRALMQHQGVTLSLPYMDDKVLEAALAISRAEALPAWENSSNWGRTSQRRPSRTSWRFSALGGTAAHAASRSPNKRGAAPRSSTRWCSAAIASTYDCSSGRWPPKGPPTPTPAGSRAGGL